LKIMAVDTVSSGDVIGVDEVDGGAGGGISKFTITTTLIALLLAITSSLTITQMSQQCLVRSK
jgi:hypothetical protein